MRCWHALETAMAIVGLFLLGVVCLWLVAAILGLYWDILRGGFAAGRYAMGFLLGWWPR